jgi:cytoskeletal protein CcmA (bactofilin family)
MFSSRSKAGPAGSKGGRSTFSFIGPEVTVTGDVASAGQLHIDGRVDGDVRCATLIQGESGTIAGNIVADEARLAGLIDGAVSAGTLVLEPSARVTGDVLYETLTIATGAQIDGRFKRRPAEAAGPRDSAAASAPPVKPVKPTPELFGSESVAAVAAE